jgi:hypothetical protein
MVLVLANDPARSPAEIAPSVIGELAKGCKGKFLSGAMPGEGDAAARAFTACESGGQLETTYLLTTRRPQGGYYVFSTFASGSEAPAKEADERIRAAAAKVIAR